MKGKAYLVGAGPGDYGLLTLKGLKCIQEADVIVYDRLVNLSYLKETKVGCKQIYVGKISNNHTLTQEQINKVLVEEALKGQVVTRLKGGDPYVFGRGGEEGEYLVEHNIPFEVVPGVTSAIGGLCYAGIPITHRNHASSFHVVTGHLKDEDNQTINWRALAQMEGTIVFLMGVSNLDKICNNLIQSGMSQHTSVAVINWATTPDQKVVIGCLETIVANVKKEKVTSPSLIVVGEVVKLREKLNFFEHKPLFGTTIITTRSRQQSSRLVAILSDLGGRVIEVPTIQIEPIEDNQPIEEAINNLSKYTHLIFSSQNAVRIFFERLDREGLDARALNDLKVAVIGDETKRLLKEYGIRADIVPKRFTSEDLCEILLPQLMPTDKILIPTAEETRGILREQLEKVCMVHQVAVYRNVLDQSAKELVLDRVNKGEIDYITFTSSSTVKNFVNLIGKDTCHNLEKVKLISIGDITSEMMQQLGLKVYRQPNKASINDVVDCIVTDCLNNKK